MGQIKGVGPITALVFILPLEDPNRFRVSRVVGPFLGLVPKRNQSGDVDQQGGITKTRDCNWLQVALVEPKIVRLLLWHVSWLFSYTECLYWTFQSNLPRRYFGCLFVFLNSGGAGDHRRLVRWIQYCPSPWCSWRFASLSIYIK